MPNLLVPLEKEFKITEGPGLSEADPIVITFRQTTQGADLQRQEMLAKPIRRQWDNQDNFSISEDLIPFAKRMAVDVWLTLVACNITNPDGQSLVFPSSFLQKCAFDAFNERWGKLPPEWAEAIYEKCLKVNPVWGSGVPDENEDEEILSEGNAVAGEPAIE